MAANPFDQFDAPAANPFDQFDTKSGTSGTTGSSTQPTWTDTLLQHLAAGSPWDPNAPAKTLATTPFWAKPADASWGDYAAAHLQPIDDAVRSAANVFGGDRFAAMMSNLTGVGGGDLAAQRAESAAAAQRDPSMTAAGNVLGGTMLAQPIGEVAQGGRAIGTAAGVPGWLASRFAGGTRCGAGAAASSRCRPWREHNDANAYRRRARRRSEVALLPARLLLWRDQWRKHRMRNRRLISRPIRSSSP